MTVLRELIRSSRTKGIPGSRGENGVVHLGFSDGEGYRPPNGTKTLCGISLEGLRAGNWIQGREVPEDYARPINLCVRCERKREKLEVPA